MRLGHLLETARRLRMTTHKRFGRGTGHAPRLSLCDRNPEVARALASVFAGVDGVEVLEGNLLDLDGDALVSPANSFGYMDGGIDRAIDAFYGGAAQRMLLERVAESFYGEIPVGTATVLELTSKRFPFLIVAPTMRVPGPIAGTIHIYLAMRAALIAAVEQNRTHPRPIGRIVAPGLGTGVGGMPAEDAARQMRAAYHMIVGQGWRRIAHPAEAPFTLDEIR